MPRLTSLLVVACLALPATAASTDSEALHRLLDDFLAGATVGDIATHERFWANDLVYTSSNGTRTDKAGIIERMKASQPGRDEPPAVVYSAEDVDIRIYGSTAVVAFRLVGTTSVDSGMRSEYFNTGTFLKRDDAWRAVAWQATIIPPPD